MRRSLGAVLKETFTHNWESNIHLDLSEKIYNSYQTINREEKLRKLLWRRVLISSSKRILAFNHWKYLKSASALKSKCNMLKKYIYKTQRGLEYSKNQEYSTSSQATSTAISLLSQSSSQPQFQKCERKAENPAINRLYYDRFRKDEILKIKQQNAMARETEGCTFQPELVAKHSFVPEREVFDRLSTSYRKDVENLRSLERDVIEMRECTFSPKLVSKQMNRSTSISSLYQDAEVRKHKLRSIQVSEIGKDLEECTFKPEILNRSIKLAQARSNDESDIHTKLYNHHSQTLRKRRTQEMQEITLRSTQALTMSSSSHDVYDRLYQDAKEKERKRSVEPRRANETVRKRERRSGSVPDRKSELYEKLIRESVLKQVRRD